MVTDWLYKKRVLIVDDEPDILATLEDLLSMCKIYKASTFEEAKPILETKNLEIAILDIMGVDGYKLLEIAKQRKIIAVMLTAHALSPEDTVKSFKEGAAYFIPKEKMGEIVTYLNDVIEAEVQGKNVLVRWVDRFAAYYDKKFGEEWKDRDKNFWNSLPKIY
ncbi:MAG: response regulator [Deltaproteobacteria bacterium]|nr:response regulator [Deltaproteobacteria bacterium]